MEREVRTPNSWGTGGGALMSVMRERLQVPFYVRPKIFELSSQELGKYVWAWIGH